MYGRHLSPVRNCSHTASPSSGKHNSRRCYSIDQNIRDENARNIRYQTLSCILTISYILLIALTPEFWASVAIRHQPASPPCVVADKPQPGVTSHTFPLSQTLPLVPSGTPDRGGQLMSTINFFWSFFNPSFSLSFTSNASASRDSSTSKNVTHIHACLSVLSFISKSLHFNVCLQIPIYPSIV